MAGISEILVLVLLITAILILPRLFKGKEPTEKRSVSKRHSNLSVKIRIGIILSLAYPVAMALYFQPWNDHLIPYLSYGIIPVFLAWGIAWVLAGRKNK